mmetsp:Transcript_27563/g.46772  ORF Transcript_27563/g.46772 Transcript_27563/m.46772 type:complete len:237 (-) Transcript_27563:233-943(-)
MVFECGRGGKRPANRRRVRVVEEIEHGYKGLHMHILFCIWCNVRHKRRGDFKGPGPPKHVRSRVVFRCDQSERCPDRSKGLECSLNDVSIGVLDFFLGERCHAANLSRAHSLPLLAGVLKRRCERSRQNAQIWLPGRRVLESQFVGQEQTNGHAVVNDGSLFEGLQSLAHVGAVIRRAGVNAHVHWDPGNLCGCGDVRLCQHTCLIHWKPLERDVRQGPAPRLKPCLEALEGQGLH